MTESSSTLLPKSMGHVLVVDDEESNRILLRDPLEARGYRVTEAVNGEEALRQVAQDPPDVILLDVMMPGLDGFEVCRRLKGDPKTAPIPILLVTALTERSDRLTGIEAGADDFLSKPIDTQDVFLRVRNAVRSKHLFDQVQEDYHRLQELETLRDNLVHMMVHDMRSPLTGIVGNLQLLKLEAEGKLEGQAMEDLNAAISISRSLTRMISALLDVSRLEAGEMPLNVSRCDLREVARKAIATLGVTPDQSPVYLESPQDPVRASCDPEVIERVITNLTANAVKFTPKGGEVRVYVEWDDRQARVRVTDTGRGIPPEYHTRIFEKFGQVETRQQGQKYSTGLGLTFCKLAVQAHGGTIGLESDVEKGNTFWFVLPAAPENTAP